MTRRLRGARAGLREHGASILVSALSAGFGVVLLRLAAILDIAAAQNDAGQHTARGAVLSVVASAFIIIAVYVGAVVTVNTFSTVIAGRTRMIALLRLIGSSASAQRRAVASEGLLVGVVGGLIGALAGLMLTALATEVLIATSTIPNLSYGLARPIDVMPVVVVALTTWLASWVGSQRVLSVSPMEAIGAQRELSQEESLGRAGRNLAAVVLVTIGLLLLALGIAVGMTSPLGLLIAVPGGAVSFTGIVLGAHMVMPSVLRLCGLPFGSSASARLARANAVRYPERSTRTTLSLVIGVTLVTMFAVAQQSLTSMLTGASPDSQNTQQAIDSVFGVSAGLVGFSAIIAGVGMVNNLSLNVMQRTRELGLLRALGLTVDQVRRTILIESAQTVLAATIIGLILGTVYGWAGAQSLIGAVDGSGLLVPSIPWPLITVIVVAAAGLAATASISPTRRAMRMSPVVALAVE